jgi:hypothetical protein
MIAEALSQRCQLKASRSTAGRLLKKAGYTRKTACRVVNKVHEPTAVMTFCQQYQAAGDDIVCIDEAGFYVGEQGRMGYALKGKRLNVQNIATRQVHSHHGGLLTTRSSRGTGGNTKRKDRVVVADTPSQEALYHNKTTWIVVS